VRDKAMHSLGIGTMRDMRSIGSGIFLPSLQIRDYTIAEKARMWQGKMAAEVSPLWDEMITTDLNTQLTEVPVPIHLLHGRYDYTCSYAEAKAYFEHLKAPIKGFHTFDHSAHSPIFEEPDEVITVLRSDVLTEADRIADR
jgi:pimeloyl-ACP methyl ester carboxylesterase